MNFSKTLHKLVDFIIGEFAHKIGKMTFILFLSFNWAVPVSKGNIACFI